MSAKDANGAPLKLGDTVRHRMLPCDAGPGGHGFEGKAKVVGFIGNRFIECRQDGKAIFVPANVVKV